jgi:hypothetical protein
MDFPAFFAQHGPWCVLCIILIVMIFKREARTDKEMNRRHDLLVNIVQENTDAMASNFSMLRILANKIAGCADRGPDALDCDAQPPVHPPRKHRTPLPGMCIAFACLLFLSGCLNDQTRANIGASAQVIYNAAESLPVSAQVTAIQANAAAIGKAVGHEVTIQSFPAKVNP